VLGAFDVVLRHLPLDDPRVRSETPRWERQLDDLIDRSPAGQR
jgi:hypothetical protein